MYEIKKGVEPPIYYRVTYKHKRFLLTLKEHKIHLIEYLKANITSNKNMETHAHHLHKAPGKNFWHYFFEFFMLFLAVFCGFLVENFREHRMEREREVQYMKSLINDLAMDTAVINANLPLKDARIVAIDSVLLYFEDHEGTASIPGYVYRNLGRSNWDRHFRRNAGTSDQLKMRGVETHLQSTGA